ncbi:hypothetical protein PR048_027084 [Dryococelus australis]|uniref:Uncharacterized protein n=1 Tax=Dryococelus australis TaxID=614101 RepID=A0ABQ9GEG5_9NEOP|nr:hypothetical protein PR048_027084 [Dryococelus australis]
MGGGGPSRIPSDLRPPPPEYAKFFLYTSSIFNFLSCRQSSAGGGHIYFPHPPPECVRFSHSQLGTLVSKRPFVCRRLVSKDSAHADFSIAAVLYQHSRNGVSFRDPRSPGGATPLWLTMLRFSLRHKPSPQLGWRRRQEAFVSVTRRKTKFRSPLTNPLVLSAVPTPLNPPVCDLWSCQGLVRRIHVPFKIKYFQAIIFTAQYQDPKVVLPSSHQDEPGSPGRVTGFSQVGIVPDDAVGRRVFSGISRSPPLHSGTAPYSLQNTHIGSQDLAVKSRPNLFTSSLKQQRIRLERASQKQSSDTHETPYDRVKRCREIPSRQHRIRALPPCRTVIEWIAHVLTYTTYSPRLITLALPGATCAVVVCITFCGFPSPPPSGGFRAL